MALQAIGSTGPLVAYEVSNGEFTPIETADGNSKSQNKGTRQLSADVDLTGGSSGSSLGTSRLTLA